MFSPAVSSPVCEPISPKVDICTSHNTAHSKLVPSRCGNHSSATTRESQTIVQRMKMIKHACSFAAQTQVSKKKKTKEQGSSLEPRMKTVTVLMSQKRKTPQLRLKNTRLKTGPARLSKYSAVQLRVPVRVTVLSKLYRTPPWMPARATSTMPRVRMVLTRFKCKMLKACQVFD